MEDSTTDPSASESDSSSRNPRQTNAVQISERASKDVLNSSPEAKSSTLTDKNVARIPLHENSYNQTSNSVPTAKLKHATYSGGENRSRRRPSLKSKDIASHKRWL